MVDLLVKVSTHEAFHQADHHGRRGSEAPHRFKLSLACIEYAAKSLEPLEKSLGWRFYVNSRDCVGQQQFEQFVVVKSFGVGALEPFSQPLAMFVVFRFVANATFLLSRLTSASGQADAPTITIAR